MTNAAIGTVLGDRYQLEQHLAAGAVAQVYRALDIPQHRPVIIKVLDEQLASPECVDFVRRFENESRMVADLKHPGIADVLEMHTDPSGPMFIVREYVDGEALEKIIDREGALPAGRVLAMGHQILAALKAVHASGVVHCDIKPANIMIATDAAGNETVKLLDFGVDELMRSPHYQRLSMSGRPPGAPRYSAPEQNAGKPTDARTDLYAVGAVMYAALYGTEPLGEDSVALSLMKITEEAVTTAELRPQVHPRLGEVLDRATAINPEVRFQSAAEMDDALTVFERRLTEGFPSDGPPAVVSDPVPTPPVPATDSVPAPGSVPAPASAPVPASAPPPSSAPAPSAPAPAKKKKGGCSLPLILGLIFIGLGLVAGAAVAALYLVPAETLNAYVGDVVDVTELTGEAPIDVADAAVAETEPEETEPEETEPVAEVVDETPEETEPEETEPEETEPEETEVAVAEPEEADPEEVEPEETDETPTMETPAPNARCIQECTAARQRCISEAEGAHATARCYSTNLTCRRACR